jgi:hypothetical protein
MDYLTGIFDAHVNLVLIHPWMDGCGCFTLLLFCTMIGKNFEKIAL